MIRFVLLAAILAVGAIAAAPIPQPTQRDVKRLVEQLGSQDFEERETASKRLEELGAVAIEELRAACKSENPELARRAQELFRKAERRQINEKSLTPTLVELDAKDVPLDTVLAELSKQVKCEVVLGGLRPEELAGKKITVTTTGRVPFWAAVRNVCDAAELQVSSAGGFLAPGAMPYTGRAKSGVRVAPVPAQAVVLEARGDAKTRPAAVHGSVLLEVVAAPKTATFNQPTALLQAWPEPRLQWQATTTVKVNRATDSSGTKIPAEGVVTPPTDSRTTAEGVTIIRNPDGTASIVPSVGPSVSGSGNFTPNARQGLVRVKPEGPAPTAIKELGVSVFATVRSGTEPLCQVRDLTANKSGTGVGVSGVDVTAIYRPGEKGRFVAEVRLVYDPKSVQPAGVGDELPGTKGGGGPGFGNHTVHGVRVTDADGKPYTLGLSSGVNQFDPTGKRVVMSLVLELHPDKNGQGAPSALTFWGTHTKSVEVIATLKDVSLTGGK